jgi:nitroreductase
MTGRLDPLRPLIGTRQFRQFTSDPVADEYLHAITEVARWSGSSQNKQPWRFIIIRTEKTLRQIADSSMPMTRSLQTAMAAIAIVLPQVEGRAVSNAYDEGRVAERMLIAAQMLGLGSGICWTGAQVRPQVGELLGLPPDRFVRTVISLGHLSVVARAPRSAPGKARLPRSETVFNERWPGGWQPASTQITSTNDAARLSDRDRRRGLIR